MRSSPSTAMSQVRRFAVAGLDKAARRGCRGGLVIGALDETGQEKGRRGDCYLKSALGCLPCSFTRLLAAWWTRYIKVAFTTHRKRWHPHGLRLSPCRCAFEL